MYTRERYGNSGHELFRLREVNVLRSVVLGCHYSMIYDPMIQSMIQ